MQSALHLAIDTKAFSNINSCVTIRRVELKDLEALEQLSAEEGWDIGVHNLLLYYQTCPEGWFLAETADGTIVAYDSYNCLPNGLRCGFQLVVRWSFKFTLCSFFTADTILISV